MFKRINQNIKQVLERQKNDNPKSIVVYFILRFLVIACMILQIVRGDLNNAFLCFLTLILFFIPFFIQDRFSIDIPTTLEIIILFFIFAAEILGEINNFYKLIPFWDTMLHTINGFLAAGIGFALIDLLNNNSKHFKLSPLYLSLAAFCFSMTIGVLWEFFEFGADNILKTDMQKDRYVENISSVILNTKEENVPIKIDNIEYVILYDKDNNEVYKINNGYVDIGLIDTMKDLIVNFIGAGSFSIIGFISIKSENKYKTFIENFTPKKY